MQHLKHIFHLNLSENSLILCVNEFQSFDESFRNSMNVKFVITISLRTVHKDIMSRCELYFNAIVRLDWSTRESTLINLGLNIHKRSLLQTRNTFLCVMWATIYVKEDPFFSVLHVHIHQNWAVETYIPNIILLTIFCLIFFFFCLEKEIGERISI